MNSLPNGTDSNNELSTHKIQTSASCSTPI